MRRIILILALSLVITHLHAAETPEDIFRSSVSKTDLQEEYRLYIEQFPKGKYVAEAGRRIGRLEAKQEAEIQRAKPFPLIAGRYRDNGDDTVTDVTTKLQWMRCALGQRWDGSTCQGQASIYTWGAARLLRSDFAGHSDWRLPTIEALKTLVYCSSGKPKTWSEGDGCNESFQQPTIVADAFPNTPASYFWAISPDPAFAWYVHFYDGNTGANFKTGISHVRLVRSGQ